MLLTNDDGIETEGLQALRQLLLERTLDRSAASSSARMAYQAAVDARDQAEQAVTHASDAETRARLALAAAQDAKAPTEEISPKQAALETATPAEAGRCLAP